MWVRNISYEQKSRRIFAMVDRSVYVLSFLRRSIVTIIEDAHEAPVTAALWYEKSQFYVTGCG